MSSDIERLRIDVLGCPIDALGWASTLATVLAWAHARESRYVCICNAHSVVPASQDSSFRRIVVDSDMATPDGFPVAWLMRRLGQTRQERISGPDLMIKLCEQAALEKIAIYLLGSTEETLAKLELALVAQVPGLNISGVYSPPFRLTTAREDEALVARINQAEPGIVFVSLGCPKQERWMAEHSKGIRGVLIGVGAAFDFHAGVVKRAPVWMRAYGLEWLHRLISEPRRLWRRYLFTNIAFVVGAVRQLLGRLKD
mgnify:CR=1 FL=1